MALTADPLPAEVDSAAEQADWFAHHARVWSWSTMEKIVLVGLLAVVYGSILPGNASLTRLFLGVAVVVVVVVNATVTLAAARRAGSIESLVIAFTVRTLLNLLLVLATSLLLGRGENAVGLVETFFYLMLITLVTTLHDRFQAVQSALARRDEATSAAP